MKLCSIVENGITRRDALKKGIGGAIGLANGGIGGLAKMAFNMGSNVDPLADVDDNELFQTPEEEWITKIPYARLLRMFQKNPNYLRWEAGSKIGQLMTYGAGYKQAGPILKMLVKAAKDSGLDVNKIALDIPKDLSYLADAFANTPIPEADKLLDVAREAGINLPVGRTRMDFVKAANSHKEIDAKYERQKRERQQEITNKIPNEKIHIPQDYYDASSMHQSFESRLNRALAII